MKTTVAELINIAKTCVEVTLFPHESDYPNDNWNDEDGYGIYESFFDFLPNEYDTELLEMLGGDPDREVECYYELVDYQRWLQIPWLSGLGTREDYLRNIYIEVGDDLDEEDDNYQSMLLAIINPIDHEPIYGRTEYGDLCYTKPIGHKIYWVLDDERVIKEYGVSSPDTIEVRELGEDDDEEDDNE